MNEIKFKGRDGEYNATNCPDTLLEWYAKNTNNAVRMQRELAIKTLEMRKATGSSVASTPAPKHESSPPPAAKPGQAIVPRRSEIQPFVSDRPDFLNSQMMVLAQACHLISPATVFSQLPAGYSAQVTIVEIDKLNDCVNVGGALMLSAVTLKRVNTAVGLSWVMEHTKRTDDNSQRNYWSYRAVGRYLDVDGCYREVSGEYELDLRDDSARVEQIYAKARVQAKEDADKEFDKLPEVPPEATAQDDIWNEIFERYLEAGNAKAKKDVDAMRANGLSRAETGAKSRATSELIKRSEKGVGAWSKPIACMRLIRANDPAASMQALYPSAKPNNVTEATFDENTEEGKSV
jgi:hypothetical protein